MTLQENDGP